METHATSITADELAHLQGNGSRYELVKGEIRVKEPAGYAHGWIAMNVSISLGQYVREHDLGRVCTAETGFRIASDPDTVRAPDLAFVSRERDRRTGNVISFWPGAPDLAVEVISPRDNYEEVDEKVADWLEAGCRMVIVVNPRRRTVMCYRSTTEILLLTQDDVLDGGDVVPGWSLPVSEIFR